MYDDKEINEGVPVSLSDSQVMGPAGPLSRIPCSVPVVMTIVLYCIYIALLTV